MRSWRDRPQVSTVWHVATIAVVILSLGAQLVLVIRGVDVLVPEGGDPPGVATRMLRFFSYFTVQSNILLALCSFTLLVSRRRESLGQRVVRLDGLVGITVTGLVFVTVLRPIVDLDGVSAATNVGMHYVTPVLGVVGWLLFGPYDRIDRVTLGWSLAWPVAWLAYTLVHGAVSGWYPYPFIDVTVIGYGRTLLNSLGVTVLLLAVAWLFSRREPNPAAQPAGRSAP